MNIIYILVLSSTSLKICASCHKGCLPEVFNNMFQYASNIHCYNTRYTAKKNNYKISIQTNVGKQSISFMAKDIWKDLPTHLKNSSMSEFSKKFMCCLQLYCQDNKWNKLLSCWWSNIVRVHKFFLLCFFDFTRYLEPKLFRELIRKLSSSFSFAACTLFSLHLIYLLL